MSRVHQARVTSTGEIMYFTPLEAVVEKKKLAKSGHNDQSTDNLNRQLCREAASQSAFGHAAASSATFRHSALSPTCPPSSYYTGGVP